MLIDLHIHTRRGSRCSVLHTKDLVKQAKKMHLDAVCITDHNTAKAVERVRSIGKEQGLIVLGGMEVRCQEGDVLAFGLQEPPAHKITAKDLLEQVKRVGGALIVAHPFRASASSLGRKIFEVQGFDAIEVLNGNSTVEENRMAQEAAQKLQLPGTGGSDAHSRNSVGKYVTEFDDDSIKSEQELIAALKSGRYRPKQLLEK
ncbi:MAG TPA: PHP domain-containing protein [Methanotrichaceae archaeon]|nr:PHP domain-containing protein [Methanotrichaceae archaeon]